MIGAVAYDAKVVPIWEGIREYFRGAPVEMDFVLFSNYEAQVEALLGGRIDVAWNTNLAYVRTHRETDGACRVLAMRDTDVEFFTLLVGRTGELSSPADLKGKTLALGSADSAQAAIMPVHFLTRDGLALGDEVDLIRFDSDVGKHGDTGRSEREGLEAVLNGRAAAWRWGRRRGTCSCVRARCPRNGSARSGPHPPTRTATSRPCQPSTGCRRCVGHASARDGLGTAEHRRILELEGLREWVGPQLDGYRDCSRPSTNKGSRRDGERRSRGPGSSPAPSADPAATTTVGRWAWRTA